MGQRHHRSQLRRCWHILGVIRELGDFLDELIREDDNEANISHQTLDSTGRRDCTFVSPVVLSSHDPRSLMPRHR